MFGCAKFSGGNCYQVFQTKQGAKKFSLTNNRFIQFNIFFFDVIIAMYVHSAYCNAMDFVLEPNNNQKKIRN